MFTLFCLLRLRLCFLMLLGSEDDDQDTELRLYAVDSYMELSEQPVLPDVLIKIMCWVSL